MLKTYSKEDISAVLKTSKILTPRDSYFWSYYFEQRLAQGAKHILGLLSGATLPGSYLAGGTALAPHREQR